MAKETLSDKLARALLSQGYTECEALARYRRFCHPRNAGIYAFVGKKGALRFGRTVTDSRAANDYTVSLALQIAESVEKKPVDESNRV